MKKQSYLIVCLVVLGIGFVLWVMTQRAHFSQSSASSENKQVTKEILDSLVQFKKPEDVMNHIEIIDKINPTMALGIYQKHYYVIHLMSDEVEPLLGIQQVQVVEVRENDHITKGLVIQRNYNWYWINEQQEEILDLGKVDLKKGIKIVIENNTWRVE